MTKEPEKESAENKSLRSLLQKLEPVKAPWYLQARLQQRIAGSETKSRHAIRPLVAIPASAALVGLILYFSSPVQEDRLPAPDGIVLPGLPPVQGDLFTGTDDEEETESGRDGRQEEFLQMENGSPSRGPSDEQPESILPASIQEAESRPVANDPPARSSIILNRKSALVADSLRHFQSIQDSLDSLQLTADSLRTPRQD